MLTKKCENVIILVKRRSEIGVIGGAYAEKYNGTGSHYAG